MSSIAFAIESSKNIMSDNQREIFIMSISKLLLGSLWTRHMIFCIIKFDILNFTSCLKYPKYILAWSDDSTCVIIQSLGLLPILFKEIILYERYLPNEVSVPHFLKIIQNIVKTLLSIDNIFEELLNVVKFLCII
jgi:hypothetical protein